MKWNNRSFQYGLIPILGIIALIIGIISMRYGAVVLTLDEVLSSFRYLFTPSNDLGLNERIFMEIRLPRVILCMLVGASLSVGGVLLQGFFRNPIVEPGLVGTSCGAAFGAALYYALGATFQLPTGPWTLPLAACLGAILATFLVFSLSRSKESGRSSIITLLLTGIAINALFLSGVGFLSYIARDPQARSIVFWNLGTMSGANWNSVLIVSISTLGCIALSLRYAKQLNALMMGEQEAQFIGVNLKRLKWRILLINVILVAVATAFVGVISFVGLIVPHLLRILKGSDNRFLIVGSALLGGILLTLADLLARMVLRPAELPIGIVTSLVGVPIFIFLLRKKNYLF